MNWTVVHNNKSVFVFCLLGDSPVSEFYVLTLWNTLYAPSSYFVMTYEDGIDRVPKHRDIKFRCWVRKNTTFTRRRKFEIKNKIVVNRKKAED